MNAMRGSRGKPAKEVSPCGRGIRPQSSRMIVLPLHDQSRVPTIAPTMEYALHYTVPASISVPTHRLVICREEMGVALLMRIGILWPYLAVNVIGVSHRPRPGTDSVIDLLSGFSIGHTSHDCSLRA